MAEWKTDTEEIKQIVKKCRDFKGSLLKNRDLGFDAAELEQIAKGLIPRGYLWHFDANVLGNLALVKEELLLGVKHTKGYLLWKQFLQTQN